MLNREKMDELNKDVFAGMVGRMDEWRFDFEGLR